MKNAAMPLESNLTALYLRVSTEDQGEKYSLPAQKRSLQDAALQRGLQTLPELIFVDERTGGDMNRPGFQALMDLVRGKRIQHVLVYSIDRLTRNAADAMTIMQLCQDRGVKLEFLNFTIDDTPQGEFSYGVMALVGQLERKIFKARSMAGRLEKAKQGFLNSGSAPYGYDYLGKSKGERGKLVINEAAAQTVRLIFKRAEDGATMYQIKKYLNDHGIPSARGGTWSRRVVYQVLRNEAYIGRYVHGRLTSHPVVIPCPPIIAESTFYSVATILERNRTTWAGRPSRKYLLRGMVWCGKCGHRCTTNPGGKKGPVYRCGNINHHRYEHLCGASAVRQTTIETAVFQAVWELVTDPKTLWRLVNAEYVQQSKAADGPSLTARIEKLKRQEARIELLMLDPDLELASIKPKLMALRAERTALEQEARRVVFQMPSRSAIDDAVEEIGRVPDPDDFDGRRKVLETVKCEVRYDDRTVEIKGRVPLAAARKNCDGRQQSDHNSFDGIPFSLIRKIA